MATFLFWNTNGKNVQREIVAAAREHDVDVLILAEPNFDITTMTLALNADLDRVYTAPFSALSPLAIFVRYTPPSYAPIYDEGGVALRLIRPPIGREILLVAVHLPSKLHRSEHEQTMLAVHLSGVIRDAENKLGHQNTVLIGDLNMSPFEPGMIAASAIHATMDKRIASRIERRVDGKMRSFFYNPMWNWLGDENGRAPGTYFYASGDACYFWHMFDQVLLRPGLLDVFSPSNLKILTEVNGHSLIRNDRINRQYSDHLPIVITLDLEREA